MSLSFQILNGLCVESAALEGIRSRAIRAHQRPSAEGCWWLHVGAWMQCYLMISSGDGVASFSPGAEGVAAPPVALYCRCAAFLQVLSGFIQRNLYGDTGNVPRRWLCAGLGSSSCMDSCSVCLTLQIFTPDYLTTNAMFQIMRTDGGRMDWLRGVQQLLAIPVSITVFRPVEVSSAKRRG